MPEETLLEAEKPCATDSADSAHAAEAGKAAESAPDVAVADEAAAAVRFKGWRGGLLIHLPAEGDWERISDALAERLAVTRDFWEGAPATIDLGSREVSSEHLTALAERLREEFALEPAGIVSAVEEVREAAAALDLEVHETVPVAQPKPVKPDPRQETRYIRGTVRSGMVMDSPGNLVIVGDVNAGSELRAGGDIIVMGTLRGVAHAGYGGHHDAQILAINLRPTQLRIGDLIARAP
ncbi:MAG: septum site-determining protein MinC, partial [Candidatus Sericytochromatia bacterium]|nr:septum site-determining protein MinC [Candidatus Tanganyikabacteria bacterium]